MATTKKSNDIEEKVIVEKNEVFSNSDITSKHIDNVYSFLNLIERLKSTGFSSLLNGLIKCMVLVFTIMVIKFLINPRPTIEYFLNLQSTIQTEKHTELVDLRLKNSPYINNYLKQLRLESGMNRAFIIEFHNGNNNAANLPFYYGDMTYESVEGRGMVTSENTNFSLTRFNFANQASSKGFFFGTIDEIREVDEQFANRVASVGSTYLALLPLYDKNSRPIGLLGISSDSPNYNDIDTRMISALLGVYSSKIERLLTPESANIMAY